MKFNKWTLGLAAVGAVSMASAVRADEAKLVPLNTAVSSTVISGYVDVAAQYNAGDPTGKNGIGVANTPFGTAGWGGAAGAVDAFSLNAVVISLDKPLDESPWASGYHIDLNWGNAAQAFGANGTALPVRQAYVTMRTPIGNGIDWKMGAFDGVTGYEGNTGYANPNYTRSYGYQVNPASELGFIGSYKLVDGVTMQMGIAERNAAFGLVGQARAGLSSKDYIATLSLTAPESWGWLKGSTLNAGTVQGFDNGSVNNYSVNATLATPVAGLKVGVSYDAVQTLTPVAGPNLSWDGNIYGIYATYQATDKLAFNLRGELVDASGGPVAPPFTGVFVARQFEELTATIEYDLWANVVSRAEFRWDHAEHGQFYNNGSGTGAPSTQDSFLLALNLVYKF